MENAFEKLMNEFNKQRRTYKTLLGWQKEGEGDQVESLQKCRASYLHKFFLSLPLAFLLLHSIGCKFMGFFKIIGNNRHFLHIF